MMSIKNFVSKVFGRVSGESTIYSAEEIGTRKPAKLEDKQPPQGFDLKQVAEIIDDLPTGIPQESALAIVRRTLTAAGIDIGDLDRSTRAEVSKLNSEIELAQTRKKDLEDRISRASAELEDIQRMRSFLNFPETEEETTDAPANDAPQLLEQPFDAQPLSRREPRARRLKHRLAENIRSFLNFPETEEERADAPADDAPQLLEQPFDTEPLSRRELSRRELRARRRKHRLPKNARSLMGFLLSLLAALILVFGLIRPFVVEAFYVPTESMVPTLEVGDRVLANKFIYYFTEPERGDIIVFKTQTADGEEQHLVKRVVGLPGDEIAVRGGVLLVNGVPQKEPYLNPDLPDESSFGPTEVPPEHVFAMGDNRSRSADSRFIGPIPETEIAGKVIFRVWPPNRLGLF